MVVDSFFKLRSQDLMGFLCRLLVNLGIRKQMTCAWKKKKKTKGELSSILYSFIYQKKNRGAFLKWLGFFFDR